ncbi:MAG: hypothetical protein MK171_10235 [Pirellulales bacterium]|nr:hypothetical protein [Pirellulales bacterium]
MQWIEVLLWLDASPSSRNDEPLLTICLIPLALLAEVWDPLSGSTFVLSMREQ